MNFEPRRWGKYAGAFAGLWLLSRAAVPRATRALTSQEAEKALARLSDYRCPFGTPIAMVQDDAVRTRFWRGEKGVLLIGEMSVETFVAQALAAERFVFVEASATGDPPPSQFLATVVKPKAVRSWTAMRPDMVLIAAPPGYQSSGETLTV